MGGLVAGGVAVGVRIKIDDKKLAKDIKRRNAGIARAIHRGLKLGAGYGRTLLVDRSPRDEGGLAAAWDVSPIKNMVGKKKKYEALTIFNDMPYASVVELGTRQPYWMGRKGITALTGWVRRVFGIVDERKARSIAFAIRHKFATKRREGTYFVRDSVDEIGDHTLKEIVRQILKVSQQKVPT
jgi:hypothetical protein